MDRTRTGGRQRVRNRIALLVADRQQAVIVGTHDAYGRDGRQPAEERYSSFLIYTADGGLDRHFGEACSESLEHLRRDRGERTHPAWDRRAREAARIGSDARSIIRPPSSCAQPGPRLHPPQPEHGRDREVRREAGSSAFWSRMTGRSATVRRNRERWEAVYTALRRSDAARGDRSEWIHDIDHTFPGHRYVQRHTCDPCTCDAAGRLTRETSGAGHQQWRGLRGARRYRHGHSAVYPGVGDLTGPYRRGPLHRRPRRSDRGVRRPAPFNERPSDTCGLCRSGNGANFTGTVR